MLALRHLKYFIAISEERSFVSAARKLNTVQSSLSQQMKDLEDYVGVDLFERGSRVIVLTSAGEIFLEEAKKALIEAEKTQNFAFKLSSSENVVNIGVLIGVELKIPQVFLDLIRDCNSKIKINLISEMGPTLMQMLEKGEIDLAFTRCNIVSDEILSVECIEEDLVIVLPKEHKLNKYSHIPMKELNNADFIIPSVNFAPELNQLLRELFIKHNIEPNIVAESENAFVTMSYVNMGMGLTILPDYIQSIQNADSTVKRFLKCEPKIKLYINYKKENNPVLDNLINTLELFHKSFFIQFHVVDSRN